MSFTNDQKVAAIEAASNIVVALINKTSAFNTHSGAGEQGDAAASAFEAVYQQIKDSAG